MKITFLHTEYNGCALWRMFEPARFLKKHGVEVNYFPRTPTIKGSVQEFINKCKGSDLVVSMRVSNMDNLNTLMVIRHVLRVPLVMETDDNFLEVDPHNLAYKFWRPGGEACKAAYRQCLSSDLFQFSTMPLKRFYGYKFNKPTWVQPNLIDYEKWEALKNPNDTDEIRLVWAGSATHYGDVLVVRPVIDRLLEKYPKLKMVFCGMKPDFIYKDTETATLKDRYEVIAGADFHHWGKCMSSMKADICMTPLDDIRFNKDKSNCRFLEWSCLGVPGVWSSVYPYENTISHEKDGFLVKTHRDRFGRVWREDLDKWYEYLCRLIESKDLRHEIAFNAFEKVKKNYSLQNNIGIWEENYRQMVNSHVPMHDIDQANEYLKNICQVQADIQ